MVVWPPPSRNRRPFTMIAWSHVNLTPNDRSHTGLDRGLVELKRAKKVAVISHRHSGHSEAGNLNSKVRNPDRRVEQRVMRMEMKMDKGRRFGSSAHGAMIPRSGGARSPARQLISRRSGVAQFEPFRSFKTFEILMTRSEENRCQLYFSFKMITFQRVLKRQHFRKYFLDSKHSLIKIQPILLTTFFNSDILGSKR